MRTLSWLALAAGLCSLLWLPFLPSLLWPLGGLLACALASFCWPVWRTAVWFMAGMAWAVWRAGIWQEGLPPPALEGKTVTAIVRVDGLPEPASHGRCRIMARPDRQWLGDFRADPRQRWSLDTPCLDYWPGDRWRLALRLKQSRSPSSGDAFDSEAWAAGEGLTAAGTIKSGERLTPGSWSADTWRLQIRQRFEPLIRDNPRAGIALALLTGDRSAVDERDNALFMRAGISHLMAISGPHVVLVAMTLAAAVRRILQRSPAVFRQLPWPRAQGWVVLIGAVAYGLLSGFSLPTQRTVAMVALCTLLGWLKHRATPVDLLVRSLGILLFLDPMAAHGVGFWLSFIAVACLVFYSMQDGPRHPVAAFWRVQLFLFMALAPVTLYFFGQMSLVSPLANTLAIPVIGFVVVPLDLAGLALGGLHEHAAMACWFWAGAVVDGLLRLLAPLTGPSWVVAHAGSGPLGEALPLLILTLILLPKSFAPRWLLPFWILPCLTPAAQPAAGALTMTVLDVGQGLAVVLETRHHVLLYDTGPTEWTGERIVLPWLRRHDHDRLDKLVISHNDSDHSGGAQAVIDALPIERGEFSAWPMLYGYPAGSSAGFCRAGDHWRWDDVEFRYLSPAPEEDGMDENNRSCVLKVSGPGFSVLLTGDIEAPAERLLLSSGQDLRAKVLLLGHHGSRTSSSEDFLRAVAPERGIVSAGYRNRYHHPSPAVMQRLLRLGIPADSTIERGTLVYRFSPGGSLAVDGARDIRHYWRN